MQIATPKGGEIKQNANMQDWWGWWETNAFMYAEWK